jgi:hypothetical protein
MPALEGIPYDEYAKVKAHNFSKMKFFRLNPKAYKKNRDDPKRGTANQSLLRYQHAATLEPHTVADDFVFWVGEIDATHKTKADRTKLQTSASSTAYGRFEQWATAAGQSVVMDATPAQRLAVKQALVMADFIRAHPDVAIALSVGVAEISISGFDTELGHNIKCRTDILSQPWGLDLKDYGTTEPRRVGQMAWKLGGVHQLAYNRRCVRAHNAFAKPEEMIPEPEQWAIVSIDGITRDVVRRTIDPNDLAAADKEIIQWFAALDECEESGHWPGYGDGMLDLPGFAFAPDIDDFIFGEE